MLSKHSLFGFALCALVMLSADSAPAQDRSGLLTGRYYYRYLHFTQVASNSTIGHARSLIGSIDFDGRGGYAASSVINDSSSGGSNGQTVKTTGSYYLGVSGTGAINGLAEPDLTTLISATPNIIEGMSYAAGTYDLFVAIPAPTAPVSSALLKGEFVGGIFDMIGGSTSTLHTASFHLRSDGTGQFTSIPVRGAGQNMAGGMITQNIAAASYTLDPTDAGSVDFGMPAGSAGQSLLSGNKTFFVSADGNVILGGNPAGYDLLFAMRPSANSASAALEGTFYLLETQLDTFDAAPSKFYFGYVGSGRFSANAQTVRHMFTHQANQRSHDRLIAGDPPFVMPAGGLIEDSTGTFVQSADGSLVYHVGFTNPGMFIAARVRDFKPVGTVFLHPLGIVNAGSYAPGTFPLAPGEFINLYGSGLAKTTMTAPALPLPTSLANVSVTIGGVKAPLYYVSPQQITAIVPYGIDLDSGGGDVVVTNSGVDSNPVDMGFTNSAPGLFTISQNGLGPAALLHTTDYSVVSASNPAHPGEYLALYLTGLGAVSPAVPDGQAAPSSPLAETTAVPFVSVGGRSATVQFHGLAPGIAGLSQINFRVPLNVTAGELPITIQTPDAEIQQGTLIIGK